MSTHETIEIWISDFYSGDNLDLVKVVEGVDTALIWCMRCFKVFSVRYMYIQQSGEKIEVISPNHRICFHLLGGSIESMIKPSNHLIDIETGEPAIFTSKGIQAL